MEQIAVGDTVYLNSGSPPLRVDALTADLLTVSWEATDRIRQEHSLPLACVTKEERAPD